MSDRGPFDVRWQSPPFPILGPGDRRGGAVWPGEARLGPCFGAPWRLRGVEAGEERHRLGTVSVYCSCDGSERLLVQPPRQDHLLPAARRTWALAGAPVAVFRARRYDEAYAGTGSAEEEQLLSSVVAKAWRPHSHLTAHCMQARSGRFECKRRKQTRMICGVCLTHR